MKFSFSLCTWHESVCPGCVCLCICFALIVTVRVKYRMWCDVWLTLSHSRSGHWLTDTRSWQLARPGSTGPWPLVCHHIATRLPRPGQGLHYSHDPRPLLLLPSSSVQILFQCQIESWFRLRQLLFLFFFDFIFYHVNFFEKFQQGLHLVMDDRIP